MEDAVVRDQQRFAVLLSRNPAEEAGVQLGSHLSIL